MSRVLSVLILGSFLVACRPPAYVQPTETQPHAILKIRHVVHQRRGPQYASAIRIGRFSVDERTLDATQEGASTIHLRIHPTPDSFGVSGTSFHVERRMVTKYRTVRESYSCSRQDCTSSYSYGSSSSSRTCRTVHDTCYRNRQESYQDWDNVTVTDDQCGQAFPLAPTAGSTYLLQFDYLGENQCRLSCFEQRAPVMGTDFQLVPCAPATLAPESGRR